MPYMALVAFSDYIYTQPKDIMPGSISAINDNFAIWHLYRSRWTIYVLIGPYMLWHA